MSRRRRLLLVLGLASIVVASVGFAVWKRGTPYGDPYWSPSGWHYVQKYSNVTVSTFLPAMPGQGSDGIDGYIRLFDRDGRLLEERFRTFLRDVEPRWTRDSVYFLGDGDISWPLSVPANGPLGDG